MTILWEHTKQEILEVLEYHHAVESNVNDRLTPRMRELSQAIQLIRGLSATPYTPPPQAAPQGDVPVEVREALEQIVNGNVAWDWIGFGNKLPAVEIVRAWLATQRPTAGEGVG